MTELISIITATYNSDQAVTTCLDSLMQQAIPFEHIIVDGGSTDGTLGLVRAYEVDRGQQSTIRVITEPDDGLYDALNKGVQLAAGGVVGILHADDFYADVEVLSRVAKVFEDPLVEACYGDLLYVRDQLQVTSEQEEQKNDKSRDTSHQSQFSVKRYWKSGGYDPRKFYWGWMPPHPTFFVRKSVYEKYGLFNLGLGTAADYELMLRFLVKHQISCKYIPEVLVCMRTGGMSNASMGNRLRANRNDRRAWEINRLKPYPWTVALKPLRKIPQYFMKPGTWDEK